MIKEIDSLAYMRDLLKGKKDDKELFNVFFEAFDKKVFSSNDLYPEIFALTYRNDHPYLNDDYKGYLTFDIAMQWMPYNDYRESKEELDKAIDQENFHCYQLHLYLYYSSKEEREVKMVKEWQILTSSYKDKETKDREAFLNAIHETLEDYRSKGYQFLGYDLDFSDAQ